MADPTRSTFVQQEFRRTTIENLATFSTYPGASEITIDTNLDASAGAALASTIFARTNPFAYGFEYTVEKAYSLDDFCDALLRWSLNFTGYPAQDRTFVTTTVSIDPFADTTDVQVRA